MSQRRDFLKQSITLAGGLGLGRLLDRETPDVRPRGPRVHPEDLFKISLAEWSLHRTLFDGALDHLDFARTAREEFGIDAIEYVNQFFFDKANDKMYLREMKLRAEDQGVRSLLIMCDREGRLGDPDEAARIEAVENHYKWIEAASYLGCHSIRVNAASEGPYDEQMKLAADGLHRLSEYGDQHGVNVLVENHGGLSSNGEWLAAVVEMVDHPLCGTLPDFGNFRISARGEEPEEWYDRYQGVEEMMPYAKAVSAKTHDFNESGYETHTDYVRMMQIVLDAGYRGHVGIEYEGQQLEEAAGIQATLNLLRGVRAQLAEMYS